MDKTFFNVSFSILIGLFTIFALSFTGFIFHIPINIFYPLIGFAAFNITFYLLSKKESILTVKIESGKILNYLTFITLYTYGVYALGKFSKTCKL